LTFTFSLVPEPESFALRFAGLGLAGFVTQCRSVK
jgi:hypothetical protein